MHSVPVCVPVCVQHTLMHRVCVQHTDAARGLHEDLQPFMTRGATYTSSWLPGVVYEHRV